ncbi:hypothetical protein CUMW_114900 [Citrus unshiu]|nr:hypothetical protein CUMW_114900 [Citrus unshiu]
MDFHSLTRKELQTLCKKNKIPANITNIAMADALSDLQYVEGLDDLMMNQEKAAPQTPSIPHTVSRTKDPETAEPLTRSRRTTTRRAVLDQGSKKDVAETPAPAASSTTSRTRGRKAQVDSSVAVRTRQSVRLLEKNMAELSLKDSKARAAAPVIKMDSLDQTVEEYHQKKAHKDEIDAENLRKNQFATGPIVDKDAEDDSNSQNFVANQQENPIAKAVSDQFATESTVDTNTDNDLDSQNSVANQQGNLIAEADSKQFATEPIVDAEADDDSDSQKPFGNQQNIHIAEAYSNLFATESIAAETETDADSSASDTDADDDSGSQKSISDQLDIQTTAAECIEDELFDVGLMEAYEDETPNSNSVEQQISHSSSPPLPPGNSMKKSRDIHVMFSSKEFAMASSPAAIAKQSNCCDSSGPAPNQSEASNQKLAALIQADNKENIDSSGMVLIMKDEESNKKDNVKKKRNNINIAEDDSKPKSLNDKSLRQLTKMLKEKLQISNNKKNNEEKNNTIKKQVPRPALQTLPENLMPAGGPKNEN